MSASKATADGSFRLMALPLDIRLQIHCHTLDAITFSVAVEGGFHWNTPSIDAPDNALTLGALCLCRNPEAHISEEHADQAEEHADEPGFLDFLDNDSNHMPPGRSSTDESPSPGEHEPHTPRNQADVLVAPSNSRVDADQQEAGEGSATHLLSLGTYTSARIELQGQPGIDIRSPYVGVRAYGSNNGTELVVRGSSDTPTDNNTPEGERRQKRRRV